MNGRSWFRGICKVCGFNVVVTQPDTLKHPDKDYWWYCSNKKCINHEVGEHTGDMGFPDWIARDVKNIKSIEESSDMKIKPTTVTMKLSAGPLRDKRQATKKDMKNNIKALERIIGGHPANNDFLYLVDIKHILAHIQTYLPD